MKNIKSISKHKANGLMALAKAHRTSNEQNAYSKMIIKNVLLPDIAHSLATLIVMMMMITPIEKPPPQHL